MDGSILAAHSKGKLRETDLATQEEEIIKSQEEKPKNPWMDKEYKYGSPLRTREPGLEIDDIPERLGLLNEVSASVVIGASSFINLSDTPEDYGKENQFARTDGEGTITWQYPFWKPTGSNIYFKQRVAIGHSHPSVQCHIYKPETACKLRVGAKQNPWIQWESTDGNYGVVAGISDYTNKKFSIDYDTPIGTKSKDFICLDLTNSRIGVYTDSPQVAFHIKPSATTSATYHPHTIFAIESTTNSFIQICAGTNAGIAFTDSASNPPPGGIVYDHANEWMEFIVGTDERFWLRTTQIETDLPSILIDGISTATFIADSHNDDAWIEFQEDAAVKWSVGFDYNDSLALVISEGVPGTNNRVRIDPTTGHVNLSVGGQQIQFTGASGGNGEGILYKDSGATNRYGLFFPGSNVVALGNRASNGVVQLRANTSTAGAAGEVTVVTVEDTDVILADGIGLNLQEDITFGGATGVNMIVIPDALADALSIQEGANKYLTFTTTNGSEKVTFGKVFAGVTGSTIGTLTLADGSITDSGGAISFGDENLSTTGTFGCNTFTMTSNSDTVVIAHDGDNPSIKWSDGHLKLITDEGENTNSVVSIFGKGTGEGYIRLYDEDDAEYLEAGCQGGGG